MRRGDKARAERPPQSRAGRHPGEGSEGHLQGIRPRSERLKQGRGRDVDTPARGCLVWGRTSGAASKEQSARESQGRSLPRLNDKTVGAAHGEAHVARNRGRPGQQLVGSPPARNRGSRPTAHEDLRPANNRRGGPGSRAGSRRVRRGLQPLRDEGQRTRLSAPRILDPQKP